MKTRAIDSPLFLALPIALAAAAAASGCGDDGAPADSSCDECSDASAGGDSPADMRVEHVGPPPTFTELYDEIFSTKCATADACHSGTNRSGFLGYASRDDAYAEMVDVPAMGSNCRRLEWMRVVPFDPEASLLLAKLEDTAMCGARMPAAGAPLDPAQIAAVRAWIEAGAPND